MILTSVFNGFRSISTDLTPLVTTLVDNVFPALPSSCQPFLSGMRTRDPVSNTVSYPFVINLEIDQCFENWGWVGSRCLLSLFGPPVVVERQCLWLLKVDEFLFGFINHADKCKSSIDKKCKITAKVVGGRTEIPSCSCFPPVNRFSSNETSCRTNMIEMKSDRECLKTLSGVISIFVRVRLYCCGRYSS